MKKIVSRIRGGLGNQLFCYAAARRLALINDAELIIDDITGFKRDKLYYRRYMLDHFNIPARKATPRERLEPLERYRRGMMKFFSRRKPFAKRRYVEEEGPGFDPWLLSLRFDGTIYLDGLWQSEKYFGDVETQIRKDLEIKPPRDEKNQSTASQINHCEAVAVHVRWFDAPGTSEKHNVAAAYYNQAISLIENRLNSPYYFVFSDKPNESRRKLFLPDGRVTFVSHNDGDENAYADLWLMTQCKHFITANSTFSWWGAWLASSPEKMIIAPRMEVSGITSWRYEDIIPSSWLLI